MLTCKLHTTVSVKGMLKQVTLDWLLQAMRPHLRVLTPCSPDRSWEATVRVIKQWLLLLYALSL
jgi:hypothetical protein